jgi:hypothetical protein
MNLAKTLFFPFFLLFTIQLLAQKDSISKVVVPLKDTTVAKSFFELSFGQSMLFITDSKIATILASNAIVIPTSAILFFAEFRPLKLIRIPVFFNLPTESKQFIINNQIVNERAPPSFGAGIEFKCFELKINTTTKLELEAGPLANFLLATNKSLRLAPLIASRVRIIRNNNFVMYVGSSYSIALNGWGLLFGTGTIF